MWAPKHSQATMPSHAPARHRRGSVMTEDTFHAMASAEQPPSVAVSDVYQALIDESAGLAPLRDAEVAEVFCYNRNGAGGHEYLMLNIRLPSSHSQVARSTVVWARAERVPSTQERSVLGVMWRGSVALDNIKFSYHAPTIRGREDVPVVMFHCINVKFIHAAHLFSIIHHHSQDYYTASFNCWWFATVTIGGLRQLDKNNDSIQFPNKSYIKAAAKILGDKTKEVTKKVTHEFLFEWNVRSTADLGDEATWEPRRDHPPRMEFLPPGVQPALPQSTSPLTTSPQSFLPRSVLTLPTPIAPYYASASPHPHPGSPPMANHHDPQSSTAIHEGGTVTGSAIMDSPGSIRSTLPLPPESAETHSDHSSIHPPLITESTSPTTAPRNLETVNLVQRVVVTHRIDDYNILIVGHQSAIPSRELFWILKTIFRDVDGDNQARIREGVLKFLHMWVLSGLLDVSVYSEVERFAEKHLANANSSLSRHCREIQAALQRPKPPTARHRAETLNGSVFTTASSASSGQRKTKKRTIVEMKPKDLTELARALFEVEKDNWGDLTIASVVESLSARWDEQMTLDSKPFSPLAEKVIWGFPRFLTLTPSRTQIQDWVIEECLDKQREVRQRAFYAFYLLACQCKEMGNYASSQAIARALCGRYLTKFEYIQGVAAKKLGDRKRPGEELQRLAESWDGVLAKIPPLDYQLRALLPAFRAIRGDGGAIDWKACTWFHDQLNQVLQQPVPKTLQDAKAQESFREFLHKGMLNAQWNRDSHEARSADLSSREPQEIPQMQVKGGW
ncbi:uncharacterized protein EI90DRAFT_3066953 [Cantharellus anzutake]|uniref:uncharacterized protein n=1 Tax=Cantharellus anzutake TaxID=1750568 RepID=UPI0019032AFA|nr:uncharacterized protein EI90DRAFT_3066953 [Cantharellus anzutake]KAF8327763.1 hypothetical protein EI90DRAFT_3066953 [Cantharellus anzutake]